MLSVGGLGQAMELIVYCADIGSVVRGRFGWARSGSRARCGAIAAARRSWISSKP
jgi:hypothetical protein